MYRPVLTQIRTCVQVLAYIEAFADAYSLRPFIQFGSHVVHVAPQPATSAIHAVDKNSSRNANSNGNGCSHRPTPIDECQPKYWRITVERAHASQVSGPSLYMSGREEGSSLKPMKALLVSVRVSISILLSHEARKLNSCNCVCPLLTASQP